MYFNLKVYLIMEYDELRERVGACMRLMSDVDDSLSLIVY